VYRPWIGGVGLFFDGPFGLIPHAAIYLLAFSRGRAVAAGARWAWPRGRRARDPVDRSPFLLHRRIGTGTRRRGALSPRHDCRFLSRASRWARDDPRGAARSRCAPRGRGPRWPRGRHSSRTSWRSFRSCATTTRGDPRRRARAPMLFWPDHPAGPGVVLPGHAAPRSRGIALAIAWVLIAAALVVTGARLRRTDEPDRGDVFLSYAERREAALDPRSGRPPRAARRLTGLWPPRRVRRRPRPLGPRSRSYLRRSRRPTNSRGSCWSRERLRPFFATKATGYPTPAAVTERDRTNFNLSSITKLFTAVAIGQFLDQEGRSRRSAHKVPAQLPQGEGDRNHDRDCSPQGHRRLPRQPRIRARSATASRTSTSSRCRRVGSPRHRPRGVQIQHTGYLLLARHREASGRDYYDYVTAAVLQRAGVSRRLLRNDEDERSLRGYALGYKPDARRTGTLPVRGTPAGGAYASGRICSPSTARSRPACCCGRRRCAGSSCSRRPPGSPRRRSRPPYSRVTMSARAVFGMSDKGYHRDRAGEHTGQAQPVADHILKLIPSGS